MRVKELSCWALLRFVFLLILFFYSRIKYRKRNILVGISYILALDSLKLISLPGHVVQLACRVSVWFVLLLMMMMMIHALPSSRKEPKPFWGALQALGSLSSPGVGWWPPNEFDFYLFFFFPSFYFVSFQTENKKIKMSVYLLCRLKCRYPSDHYLTTL